MEEVFKLLVGIFVLFLGIPLGNFLARITKEELKLGQRWFKRVIIFSLILGVVGLIIHDDVLMFSCFFIAIVTSQSLRKI